VVLPGGWNDKKKERERGTEKNGKGKKKGRYRKCTRRNWRLGSQAPLSKNHTRVAGKETKCGVTVNGKKKKK